MELSVKKENSRLTVKVTGRIDTNGAPELNECFLKNLSGIRELVIDLQEAPYVSSAGLRALLNARKAMRRKGSMKLIHVQSDVMDIFDMTGFTGLFEME